MKGTPVVLLIGLMVAAIVLAPVSSSPAFAPPASKAVFSIQFVSQTHQSLGGGCYNAQVTLALAWNGTGTKTILIQNFWAYEVASAGLTISNSTYYAHPINPFKTLTVFPNANIGLILYFANFCIVPATGPQVWLFYYDGQITVNAQIA